MLGRDVPGRVVDEPGREELPGRVGALCGRVEVFGRNRTEPKSERQQDLVRQHVPVRNLEEIDLRLLSDHLHRPEVEDLVTMLLLIKMGIRIE